MPARLLHQTSLGFLKLDESCEQSQEAKRANGQGSGSVEGRGGSGGAAAARAGAGAGSGTSGSDGARANSAGGRVAGGAGAGVRARAGAGTGGGGSSGGGIRRGVRGRASGGASHGGGLGGGSQGRGSSRGLGLSGAGAGAGAGGGGGGGGLAGRSLAHGNSARLLDALVRAGVVAVGVALGGVGVDNVDALDVHGVGSTGVVSHTASPLDGTLAVAGITTSPDTDANAHGGLGVAGSALRIGVVQGADHIAIHGPGGGILLPRDRVGVPGVLGVRHSGPSSAVISGGVTLAEVVSLNLGGVTTESFL